MRLVRAWAPTVCGALAVGVLAGSPAPSATAAVTPCSNGLVALTFDDGPRPITSKFLTTLRDRRVPAAFFMVGRRVDAAPAIARRASQLGFTLGNHTYGHESLTSLSDAGIRTTLRRTRTAIENAGARPSTLMRPPYRLINDRVRRVTSELGLVPVLWTADPRDWEGRSAAAITSSTLGQLRPGGRNIVLLHDGVGNSARTLAALPQIIRSARARGYCFAALNARGVPMPPVPRVRISDASVAEAPGGSVVTTTLRLDRPTSRPTSVRVRTVPGTAASGTDYVALDDRIVFPTGVTRRTVRVRVRNDLRDEAVEGFTLLLSGSRGLVIKDSRGALSIRDDDPPPRVGVISAQVTEPATGSVEVPVVLRLGRVSERWITVTVATVPGTADTSDYVPAQVNVTFAPGQVEQSLAVTVLADGVVEGPEAFVVRATAGSNVDLTGASGTVTILPPG